MSVVVVRRRLYIGVMIGVFLAALSPAWAETEADAIAGARALVTERKYDDALAILTPVTSAAEPTARQAKEALEFCYRSAERWADAIATLQSCLREYPADTSLWQLRLGRCYEEKGDYPRAIAALKAWLDFAPREARLTGTLTDQLWICCLASGDWGAGVSTYQSLMAKQPESTAEWNYQLGRYCRKLGKTAEATAALEKPMELVKGDWEAVQRVEHQLTDAYQDAGESAKGEALLTRLDQEHPGYLTARTNELIDRGRYDAAVAILAPMASSAGAASRQARETLEGCYRRAGQWDKAISVLESLLQEYPAEKASWWSQLAICRGNEAHCLLFKAYDLQHKGTTAEAIAGFRVVIDRFPDWQDRGLLESAHVCVAECLHQMGRPDEAMAYAKKLYDEQPEMRAGALFAQGIVSHLSGEYDNAVAALRHAIAEYPKRNMHVGLARSYVAWALSDLGRTDEAVAALRSLIADAESASPEWTTARLLEIARIYEEAKMYREAINTYKEVRVFKDASADAKEEATYRSALCHHAIKYYSSARSCMDQVARLNPDGEWARKARGALHVWASGEKAE